MSGPYREHACDCEDRLNALLLRSALTLDGHPANAWSVSCFACKRQYEVWLKEPRPLPVRERVFAWFRGLLLMLEGRNDADIE